MASSLAISLPRLTLGVDEANLIDYHLNRLARFQARNKIKEAYYEGRQRVKHLGISIPPKLRDIEVVVGWPGTTVDVLEERLDWLGWTTPGTGDPYGLKEIYLQNDLEVDTGLGILDALIYGTAFISVGTGYDGEPSPLVTVESPMRMTGEWDGRIRRLSSALSIDAIDADNDPIEMTLYLPDQNITLTRSSVTGRWKVEDRDQHNLGRVTVAQLVNRPRASAIEGRSEITPAIRAYTDQGVRTLLGMEVNREFYSAPQRYVLGADEQAFTDADGNVKTGWEAILGRMLALPKDEDGDTPTVGQFTASSPAPYLEQIRGLSQLVSAEGAIPQNYLGFSTDNPPSADAIRAMEARLIKRAERRQKGFGRTLREVAHLAVLVRDGAVPSDFLSKVSNDWTDPATPTRAAAADEAVKLVGAEILTPDSKVTYDRIGLSPLEQAQVENDKRKARARTSLNALAAIGRAQQQQTAQQQGAA